MLLTMYVKVLCEKKALFVLLMNKPPFYREFPFKTFAHNLTGKTKGFEDRRNKNILVAAGWWKRCCVNINTPLSYLQSCLVFHKCVKPIWEKPGAVSGNTASIVIAPDGGPTAGWTPASQRSALLGLSHFRPGLHCQGRTRDVFPSWHRQKLGLVLQG